MPRPIVSVPMRIAAALCLWLVAPPASAQDQVRLDVLVRGVSVAEITLAAREDGPAYALAGRVRATGLAAVFARVRFQMQAEGQMQGGVPVPRRYTEDLDTGRRTSAVEMSFVDGRPVIVSQTPPPGPEAVAPGAAAGTVDPLSALWRVVRGGDTPCGWTLPVYDGARRSEISLAPATGTDHRTCSGHYTRIAGFPAADMAERRDFPFVVRYEARSGAFVLTEVEAASLLGPIRIVRRD